jgi:OOP family OmpA-OmpF porin
MVAVAALLAPSVAHAQAAGAGVTDYTTKPPGAITAADIKMALGLNRGVRIESAAPPKAQLPIHFEFDSADTTPEARALLDQLALALQSPDLEPFKFEVQGHTDSVGSEDYNDQLSIARAQAVAVYLEAKGVAKERLRPTGKGESSPVATNADAEGRQRNRRVDFVNLGENP